MEEIALSEGIEKSSSNRRSSGDLHISFGGQGNNDCDRCDFENLNRIVKSIAHAINTPVGIGITAVSYSDSELKKLIDKLTSGTSEISDVKHMLGSVKESLNMIQDNLNKTVRIIDRLKVIEQSLGHEKPVSFDLSQHLNNVISCITIRNHFSNGPVKLESYVENSIHIYGYPSVFKAILENLVENSLVHGFSENRSGSIVISLIERNESCILKYSDNGLGIERGLDDQIFDPFYSTKMGQGHFGMGLNIIYYLVISKLCGFIECTSSPGNGFEVLISFNRISGVEL